VPSAGLLAREAVSLSAEELLFFSALSTVGGAWAALPRSTPVEAMSASYPPLLEGMLANMALGGSVRFRSCDQTWLGLDSIGRLQVKICFNRREKNSTTKIIRGRDRGGGEGRVGESLGGESR